MFKGVCISNHCRLFVWEFLQLNIFKFNQWQCVTTFKSHRPLFSSGYVAHDEQSLCCVFRARCLSSIKFHGALVLFWGFKAVFVGINAVKNTIQLTNNALLPQSSNFQDIHPTVVLFLWPYPKFWGFYLCAVTLGTSIKAVLWQPG